MIPADTDILVERLADVPLRGAVRTPTGEIALVFDSGWVLALTGTAYLLSEDESIDMLVTAAKRLARVNAELYSLQNLTGPAPAERLAARRASTQRERDINGVTNRRRVDMTDIDDVPDAPFLSGQIIGTGMSDVEARARTEAAARNVPDVL